MPDRNTLTQLVEEIGLAFAPLSQALKEPSFFSAFMYELGWELNVIPAPLQSLAGPLSELVDFLDAGEVDASRVVDALNHLRAVFEAIQSLANVTGGLPSTVDANQFANEFPRQLIDHLLINHLTEVHPPWGQLLHAIGIIRHEEIAAANGRPSYRKKTIVWENFGTLLSDPVSIFKDAWQWGTAQFSQEEWLNSLRDVAEALGLPTIMEPIEESVRDFLAENVEGPDPIHDWMLRIPLLGDPRAPQVIELGIVIYMLPGGNGNLPGFSVLPYAVGTTANEIAITETLMFTIRASFDLEGGVAFIVRPNMPSKLVYDMFTAIDGHTPAPTENELSLGLAMTSDTPFMLLGSSEGSRLEIGSGLLTGGVRLASNGDVDAFAEVELRNAKIVIRPASGESDGFLAQLLPDDGIEVEFNVGVGYSTANGVYFGGGAGLETTIPVHKTLLDILIIESVFLAARVESTENDSAIQLIIAATASLKLGPLLGVVERLGLKGTLGFPERGGNLGVADLAIGFKPPEGVGLTVDAGPVKGGGYLRINEAERSYAGALQLEFGAVSLKAVGLLTTRPKFSLLIIITAEFTPVQLGFGFTWLGVGGAIGIHRMVATEALQAAVKSGGIDDILFPTNVIENAPRIINTLSSIFPPQDGQFLIGIMGRFGWGTPTILDLKLGILIELPDPIRLVILGSFEANLPQKLLPIIRLKCDVAAIFDFGRGTFSLDAQIYDSRVYIFNLSGDIAVRANVGAKPDFMVSVGGFNPRFRPPPGFPSMNRLAISLPENDFVRVRLEAYFAVSPNTLQFGARLDVYAGVDTFVGLFSVQGYLGFDALFERIPRFRFIIDLYGGITLSRNRKALFSVDFYLSLSGPQPFIGDGYAKIDVPIIGKIRIPARFQIGEEPLPEVHPATELTAQLRRALELPGNWSAQLPSNGSMLVSLAERNLTDTVLAHPLGTLDVRQRVAPLKQLITRFGALVIEPTSFVIDSARLIDKTAPVPVPMAMQMVDLLDYFAPAEFINLTDDAKLSAPSFSQMVAGVQLLPTNVFAFAPETAVEETFGYEEIVIDKVDVELSKEESYAPKSDKQIRQVVRIGAAAQSSLRFPGGNRYQIEPLGIAINELRFQVCSTETLQPAHDLDGNAGGFRYFEAHDMLLRYKLDHPASADLVQLMPIQE